MRPRSIWRAGLVIPAIALAVTSGPASAQAAGTPGWRTNTTITVPSRSTGLFSIATAGPAHAWVGGFSQAVNGSHPTPIIDDWNGTAWAPVTLTSAQVSSLGSFPVVDTVSAAGRGNVWAFTLAGGWLHSDGTSWTAGLITGAPVIQASLAFGANGAWAFGGALTSSGFTPYAAFRAGAAGWKRTPMPGTGSVAAASAVSASDIWAVTGQGLLGSSSSPPRLLHWHGGSWRAVAGLPARLRSLGSIVARSNKNIWIGGAVRNSKKGTTEAIAHWNGGRWTLTTLRAAASAVPYRIVSIASDGSGGLWALGVCSAPKCPNGGAASRLWHRAGGSWSRPVQPKLAATAAVLTSLAGVGHSVWASGAARVGQNGSNGLIAVWGPTPH